MKSKGYRVIGVGLLSAVCVFGGFGSVGTFDGSGERGLFGSRVVEAASKTVSIDEAISSREKKLKYHEERKVPYGKQVKVAGDRLVESKKRYAQAKTKYDIALTKYKKNPKSKVAKDHLAKAKRELDDAKRKLDYSAKYYWDTKANYKKHADRVVELKKEIEHYKDMKKRGVTRVVEDEPVW